ncbi:coiled-coil domain-containing protein [Erwinia oleae]|uniref:coiled-coil domain-containing protein n=1 Tax=Erwinia oleae TaxID=796334 RepID=UPI000558C0C9|nr:hypothetical protein [Erwinia oleae]
MTELNQPMTPMTPTKKGLLRSKAFWGITGGLLIAITIAMVNSQTFIDLNQRVTYLEQAQRTMTSQDDVLSLRDAMTTQQKQLIALENRQAQFSQQLETMVSVADLPQQLQAQLKVQNVELNALKDELEVLKKSKPAPSYPVIDLSATLDKTAADASAVTAKNPLKHKTTPINASLPKPPFVLTGVELRGTAAFAAVAPKGFSDLSQVRLIGAKESVAGWTLVSAGHGQATFRVNGRLQTVKTQSGGVDER